MKVPNIEELIVVSNEDEELAYNEGFVKALGMEDSPTDENDRYLSAGGDYWIDSDKVKVNGEVQYFNLDLPYIACNFDPAEYSEHVELIKKWLAAYKEQKDWSNRNPEFYRDDSWKTWDASDSGIAYRGGSGYSYGVYLPLPPLTVIVAPKKVKYWVGDYLMYQGEQFGFKYENETLTLDFDNKFDAVAAKMITIWCEGFRTGKITRDRKYNSDNVSELLSYIYYEYNVYMPILSAEGV